MAKKLFIGSFPLDTSEQALKDLFAAHGQVQSLTIILDRATGMSRGFGFVEMSTDDQAKTAMEKLNGYKLGERSIVVKEALEKTSYRGMNNDRDFRNRRFKRF